MKKLTDTSCGLRHTKYSCWSNIFDQNITKFSFTEETSPRLDESLRKTVWDWTQNIKQKKHVTQALVHLLLTDLKTFLQKHCTINLSFERWKESAAFHAKSREYKSNLVPWKKGHCKIISNPKVSLPMSFCILLVILYLRTCGVTDQKSLNKDNGTQWVITFHFSQWNTMCTCCISNTRPAFLEQSFWTAKSKKKWLTNLCQMSQVS